MVSAAWEPDGELPSTPVSWQATTQVGNATKHITSFAHEDAYIYHGFLGAAAQAPKNHDATVWRPDGQLPNFPSSWQATKQATKGTR